MKKTLTILLILCVAATLFAASGFSVNVGGAFDLFNLKTDTVDNSNVYNVFKGNGLGFGIGVQYDFSDKIMAYADGNMVFPSDFEIVTTDGTHSETDTFQELVKEAEESAKVLTDGKASHSLFLIDASIGAAYKFDFDPIKLAVGGGAYINYLRGSVGLTGKLVDEKIDEKYVFTFLTVGVSTLIDAKYEINESVAVRLAIMPQVGIYSKRDIDIYYFDVKDEKESHSLSGVGISFTMPVTIGASYSF